MGASTPTPTSRRFGERPRKWGDRLLSSRGRSSSIAWESSFTTSRPKCVLTQGDIRLDDVIVYGSNRSVTMGGAGASTGSSWSRAYADLHIPSGDPVPLDIDGQTLGDVDCDVTLKVEGARGGTGMKVNVDIPRLHVMLPLRFFECRARAR